MSVGGAAASGLASGFQMGLQATAQQDARDQRQFENDRQTAADARQANIDQRTFAQQDKTSANADDDRALAGLNAQMEDSRFQLGNLHETYRAKGQQVPDSEFQPLYAKAQDVQAQRQALLQKRVQPVIDATTQKWRDFSSRAQAGDPGSDPSALRGDDLRDYIKATTGHDLADFQSGKIGSSINDATAGLGSGNMPMVISSAGTLMGPQLRKNLGTLAPDGSQIIDKSLYALVPAPQQMQPGQQNPALAANPVQSLSSALGAVTGAQSSPVQPGGVPPLNGATGATAPPLQAGTDPGLVMPVLNVTTRQPDGTITSYHAPVTDGRGTGPDDAISGPLKTSDLMDRMGRLGVVDNWLKTPQMAGAVQEALQNKKPTTFDQAWAAVHGDPAALTGAPKNDPTSVKISAIKALADKYYHGNFSAASQALSGHMGAPDAETPPAPDAPRTAGVGNAAPAPGAPTTGEAGAVRTAVNAANPSTPAADTERTRILQGEQTKYQAALDAAKASGDPAKIKTAQSDLDSIQSELAKNNKPIAGGAAPATGAAPLPPSTVLGTAPSAKTDDQKTIDFYAAADIAGDRNWRVGLSRSKTGSALIESVKKRIPQLAEEWGITPQDYGTINGQRAALNATLKQITSRVTANEMSADKVSRDMATYESLLADGAAANYGAKFINTPINALRRQFNDPKLAQLDLAANQVGTEYERMLQGGQLSVAGLHAGAAEDAKKLVNGDLPPDAARATMQIMTREIQNAKDASHASLDSVTERLSTLGRGNQGAASGLNSGGGTSSAPRTAGVGGAPAPGSAAPGKFVEGQTYTDGKGQKARFVGGKWVPL